MFSQDRTIKIEKEEIEEERYGIGVGRECGREERKKISQLWEHLKFSTIIHYNNLLLVGPSLNVLIYLFILRYMLSYVI